MFTGREYALAALLQCTPTFPVSHSRITSAIANLHMSVFIRADSMSDYRTLLSRIFVTSGVRDVFGGLLSLWLVFTIGVRPDSLYAFLSPLATIVSRLRRRVGCPRSCNTVASQWTAVWYLRHLHHLHRSRRARRALSMDRRALHRLSGGTARPPFVSIITTAG